MPNFKHDIQALIDGELRAGAPPIAVMLALLHHTSQLGILAAAAHDLEHGRTRGRAVRTRHRAVRRTT